MSQVRTIIKYQIFLAGLLLVCYIYLVNSTIFQAVSRQNELEKLEEHQSVVVGLEQQYLQLSGNITLERAYALGFQDVESHLARQ